MNRYRIRFLVKADEYIDAENKEQAENKLLNLINFDDIQDIDIEYIIEENQNGTNN